MHDVKTEFKNTFEAATKHIDRPFKSKQDPTRNNELRCSCKYKAK